MTPFRSKAYRNAGKGCVCVLCRRETATDAAHIRLAGTCGMGTKPWDVSILDCCRACHEKYGNMNREEDAPDVLRGLVLTLMRRAELGFFGETDA